MPLLAKRSYLLSASEPLCPGQCTAMYSDASERRGHHSKKTMARWYRQVALGRIKRSAHPSTIMALEGDMTAGLHMPGHNSLCPPFKISRAAVKS
jgi:hypothetical protein